MLEKKLYFVITAIVISNLLGSVHIFDHTLSKMSLLQLGLFVSFTVYGLSSAQICFILNISQVV